MIKIEYPAFVPRIRQENGQESIFDPFRKKWIVLTPEEWVRQNFLQYLVVKLNYPVSLIAIEKEIKLGDVKKRFDIVVYNEQTMPHMIIECKEMDVPLTEHVLHQVLRYNTNMQAKYIVITNGSYCYAFERKGKRFVEVDSSDELKAGRG